MASYKGVSVPIEGHVEKIYISSKMSIENVKKILDSIDFNDYTSDPFEMLTYVVAVNENTGEVLAIDTNCTHSYRSIYILDKDYNYTDIYADGFFVDLGKTAEELYGKSGWLKNITEIEFNSNLSSYSNNIISQVEIGGQNDKLSGLFSIKPIIEEKNILMHPKDEKGNSDKNVSLFPQTLASNLLVTTGKKFKMPNVVYQEGSLQSTIVPNTGPTGEIYFNTNLNVEEVINIFKNSNLTFYEHDFLGSSYGVFISNNTETGIFINDWGGGWDLVLYSPSFSEPIILFSNVEFGNGVIGWSPDLISNNRMDFSALNEEYVSSLNGVDFGHQNERLSMLVGATPFQKTIEGLFIAKEDGTADESKPLSLGISEEKVNELIDNKVTDNVEHTPVPNSGLIKNVYFNTSLTAYEVALKLNELTYIETQLYPYPINILFATEDFTKVLLYCR